MTDDSDAPDPLTGIVEVDETYIGGNPRAKDKDNYNSRPDRKTPVVAMVQRNGEVSAMVMPKVSARNFKKAIRENVDPGSRLMTDEASYYNKLGKNYADHQTVVHSNGEYSRGGVTTNTVESFFIDPETGCERHISQHQ